MSKFQNKIKLNLSYHQIQIVRLLPFFGCICSHKNSDLNKPEATFKPFVKPVLFMQPKKNRYKMEYVNVHGNNSK